MSRKCELTGVGPMVGNNVSHANIKQEEDFFQICRKKESGFLKKKRFITVKATAKALKTLDKKGYYAMMKELKKA
jgi:large subunit ribosomal protein L28